MEDNKFYSILWICLTIMFCTLVSWVSFDIHNSVNQNKEKEIEFAKAGLYQKVELTGSIIWVKN